MHSDVNEGAPGRRAKVFRPSTLLELDEVYPHIGFVTVDGQRVRVRVMARILGDVFVRRHAPERFSGWDEIEIMPGTTPVELD